jgi:hypothetical protein
MNLKPTGKATIATTFAMRGKTITRTCLLAPINSVMETGKMRLAKPLVCIHSFFLPFVGIRTGRNTALPVPITALELLPVKGVRKPWEMLHN